MNLFVGIGRITDAFENGRMLKFTLSVHQERPCNVPCLIFDPNCGIKDFIQQVQKEQKFVWLKGKISTYEYEFKGKKVVMVEVVSHPKTIIVI
jgi:hypothetical protein